MMQSVAKGQTMKALTVRSLPPQVAKAIRDKAKKERRSLNQTVVALLEEATLGTARPKVGKAAIHHDLDHLFGTWTKEEADEFDAFLEESRGVNPKDWE
jgi:plasmid stability protein